MVLYYVFYLDLKKFKEYLNIIIYDTIGLKTFKTWMKKCVTLQKTENPDIIFLTTYDRMISLKSLKYHLRIKQSYDL